MDDWKIRILVLDRGFVKVCRCPAPDGFGFWLPYADGRTIRVWGTTRGLAELVAGPTERTKLDDPIPTGTVPVRAIIDVIDVEQDSWARHLTPASSAAVTQSLGR